MHVKSRILIIMLGCMASLAIVAGQQDQRPQQLAKCFTHCNTKSMALAVIFAPDSLTAIAIAGREAQKMAVCKQQCSKLYGLAHVESLVPVSRQ